METEYQILLEFHCVALLVFLKEGLVSLTCMVGHMQTFVSTQRKEDCEDVGPSPGPLLSLPSTSQASALLPSQLRDLPQHPFPTYPLPVLLVPFLGFPYLPRT